MINDSSAAARFRLLGAVEVSYRGTAVPIGRPRQRAVLAYLLIRANHLVTVESLTDALWGGAAPATARAQIHADIHAVRRALRGAGAPNPIGTWHLGYRLDLGPGQLDLDDFTALIAAARSAVRVNDLALGAAALAQALQLWRGPALGDISAAYVDVLRADIEQRRLAALEEWARLQLWLDCPDEVAAELARARPEHPVRERLTGLLMIALQRIGCAPDALAVARQLRRDLVSQHGLDPGPWFTEVESAIRRGGPVELVGDGPPRPQSSITTLPRSG
jgi:DNA-binding SARP family transcriptional activator